MKQHIAPEQLNELTEEQKERLREWWEPKEGDCVYIPKGIKYGDGYGSWCEFGGWEQEEIHFIGSIERITEESIEKENKQPCFLIPEYANDNYFEIPIRSCFPLLSIGQMIEFLMDSNEISSGIDSIYGSKMDGKQKFHVNGFSRKYGERAKAIDGDSEELCDALWQAVKEVL